MGGPGSRALAGRALPVSNALRARLAGVASFALDLSRMRLRADAPLGLEIETDGPLDLRLRAPWPGPVWDGAREHAPQEDVLTLRIERSGRTELRGASAPR